MYTLYRLTLGQPFRLWPIVSKLMSRYSSIYKPLTLFVLAFTNLPLISYMYV